MVMPVAATVSVMVVEPLVLNTAELLLPLTLSQGVAVAVFHPALFVSQVMPVFVLVIEAALALETIPKERSGTSRAGRREERRLKTGD